MKVPFEFGRREVAIFLAVFVIALFALDFSNPPTRTATTDYPAPTNTSSGQLNFSETHANESAETAQNASNSSVHNANNELPKENESADIKQPVKEPTEEESPEVEPQEDTTETQGDVQVTYFFFWADYCTTCKTMMPWIEEAGQNHPTLNVKMIDLYSNSPYISRFGVTTTAVSVILKQVDGKDVSGTKMVGFMDERGIERLICTELDDARCKDER